MIKYILLITLWHSTSYADRHPCLCNGQVGEHVYNYDPSTQSYVKGGFVAATAKVSGRRSLLGKTLSLFGLPDNGRNRFLTKNVYIAPGTQVCGYAKVRGHAHVAGNAIIRNHAKITGHAYITENAKIGGKATIKGDAIVTGQAYVGGQTTVRGRVVIDGQSQIQGHLLIDDHVIITDQAKIFSCGSLTGKTRLQDSCHLQGHLDVHNTLIGGTSHIKGPQNPRSQNHYLVLKNTSILGDSHVRGIQTIQGGEWENRSLARIGKHIFAFHIIDAQELALHQDESDENSDDSPDHDCCICFDELHTQTTIETVCGHRFHDQCIIKCIHTSIQRQHNSVLRRQLPWNYDILGNASQCPMCRSDLRTSIEN